MTRRASLPQAEHDSGYNWLYSEVKMLLFKIAVCLPLVLSYQEVYIRHYMPNDFVLRTTTVNI